jgi:HPt (histidine-containing phosphotransfer) domain-containing protein
MNESEDFVPVFGDTVLLSHAMHDRELANELVRIFVDEAPRYTVQLTQAIEANDARAVRSRRRLDVAGRRTTTTAQLQAALRELNDRLTAL